MAGLSLEGKPWYVGLIIGLVLAIAIIWGANYAVIGGIDDQIRSADATLKDLDTKIEQGRSAQRSCAASCLRRATPKKSSRRSRPSSMPGTSRYAS